MSKTVLPEAEGVKSRMVDSYAVKNCYVYDYVVSQEGRPEKHIKVAILLLVRNVAAVAAAASVLDPIGRKHQSVCCVCVFFFFNFAV